MLNKNLFSTKKKAVKLDPIKKRYDTIKEHVDTNILIKINETR